MGIEHIDKRFLYAGAIAVEVLVLAVLWLVGRHFNAL
jgi:hypothetical protein